MPNDCEAARYYNLGVFYANGRGVPHDDREAARCYKLAADQGHASSQTLLARDGQSPSRPVLCPDGTTHKGRTSEQWRRVALLIENMVPVRP